MHRNQRNGLPQGSSCYYLSINNELYVWVIRWRSTPRVSCHAPAFLIGNLMELPRRSRRTKRDKVKGVTLLVGVEMSFWGIEIFRSSFEILLTSHRAPEKLRAESAEKVLPEVLLGNRLGVPEKVPKNCRKNAPHPLFLAFREHFRHFFGTFSGTPSHFGEHFFGTFGPELFGGPVAGQQNLKSSFRYRDILTSNLQDVEAQKSTHRLIPGRRRSRC